MQRAGDSSPSRVGLALQPYTGRVGVEELSVAPDLLAGEVVGLLRQQGIDPAGVRRVKLTERERGQYGVWNRVSLADAHLGHAVAAMAGEGTFALGLLGNCVSSWGMLAGLQHPGNAPDPQRVGMIWVDAHADFNTPETTLSGWIGGMPVSVAAGQSLLRLRRQAGLDPPLAISDIILMGQRDVDPLEQELIDEVGIATVSAEEMLAVGPALQQAVEALSSRVNVIYLHIDLDILDASEIPGSFFETPGGPLATDLVAPIRFLMRNPKVQALGIASFPTAETGRERSLQSTLTLVRAAIKGLTDRRR